LEELNVKSSERLGENLGARREQKIQIERKKEKRRNFCLAVKNV
jgi:hypothetical protein